MRGLLVCLVLTLAVAGRAWAQQAWPLGQAAGAYAGFETDLSAITGAQVATPDAMDGVLVAAARHDPAALSRGWLAYAALTAAQSPAFVHGLEARVRAAGRAPVLRQLLRDLSYARRRPAGADQAIQLVLSTMSADASRLAAAADRYDRLSDAWRQTPPFQAADDTARAQREQRLGSAQMAPLSATMAQRLGIGALGAAPLSDPTALGGAHFWDAAAGLSSPAPIAMAPRPDRGDLTDRVLTLAGLLAIGGAPQSSPRFEALLDDRASRQCLKVQLLEFRQCLSVAHSADEDAACLALHGLRNLEGCLSF